MEAFWGTLLLITFVTFIVLALRGYNMTFLLFEITLVWSVIAACAGLLDWATFNKTVINDAATNYGRIFVSIMFGSWMGRMLVATNIVSAIIRKTTELGGDKANVTMILLLGITSIIFTSLSSPGVVMAVGLIVLPIFLSLGIPNTLANVAFIMAVGAPMFININMGLSIKGLVPDIINDSTQYRVWGSFAFGAQWVITCVMATIWLKMSKKRKSAAWAVEVEPLADNGSVPWYALMLPILPVLMVFFLNFQVVTAMITTTILALLFTGQFKNREKAKELIFKTWKDGISDVALLFIFQQSTAIFNAAAGICAPLFRGVLGPIMPQSAFVLLIAFIVLTPLGLFRGPLTVWGSGMATVAILKASGLYPLQFLCVALVATSVTMNMGPCVTQSWTQWAISYTKIDYKDHIIGALPCCWLSSAIALTLAYYMYVM